MDGTNAHATLGVSRGANERAITRTFRKRALQDHPDVGGDPETFARLLRARDIALSLAAHTAPTGLRPARSETYLPAHERQLSSGRAWTERGRRSDRPSGRAPDRALNFGHVLADAIARADSGG